MPSLYLGPLLGVTRYEMKKQGNRAITVRSRAADVLGFEWEVVGANPDYSRTEYKAGLQVQSASGVKLDSQLIGWREHDETYQYVGNVTMSIAF